MHAASILLLAGAAVLVAPGCRGDREDRPPRQFFPDMDDQPKWEPQGQTEFFVDGRMMRRPPPGTVPFGRIDAVSADEAFAHWNTLRSGFLREDQAFFEGRDTDNTFLKKIPLPLTMEILRRGAERFNIYCAACHNYNGDGRGTVGQRWSYPLPNFHDARFKDPATDAGRDGYLFHITRNGVIGADGVQRMPGYRHAVSEADAWAIVAHIRVLQATREGTIDDVPEALQPALRRQMSAAPAPATGSITATAGATP